MKEKLVRSTWLELEGRRLDCGPYLSGAMEAKVLLTALPVATAALAQLTTALVNAGRVARTLISDPRHGRRFLSSTDILLADLSHVSIIAEHTVRANPKLAIRQGWILVTRAGTIGRMAFARPDMDGLACSEDAMRVVPDPDTILPGYLYAFLSSRLGVPLVCGSTYGAIVQHIEPEHIADLPVPLAPDAVQQEAHRLVTEAAALRTQASAELRAVVREIEAAAGLPPLGVRYDGARPDTSLIRASALGGRMDGLFHSRYHRSVLEPLLALPDDRRTTVENLADRVFWPPMFKRIRVDDARYGVPFFGTSALMRADPDASYLLARRTAGLDDLFVNQTTVLFTGEERHLSIRQFDARDKRTAYERQNHKCANGTRCRTSGNDDGQHVFEIDETEGDHIQPWSKGGKTVAENCQMLCVPCNRYKGGL